MKDKQGPPRRRLVTRRDGVGLVVAILAIVFILQNRGATTVRFLIPEVSAPLWTALVVSWLLGVVVGVAAAVHRSRPPEK